MKKKMTALKLALVAVAIWALPAVASAAPILSCPAGADCNGVSLGAELVALGGDSYRIDVVFDFTGYTGNQSDVLHAVQIKSFSSGATSNTSFAVAGTSSAALTGWTLFGGELNANGCGGGSGGIDRLCVEANNADGAGVKVFDAGWLTATFSYFFDTPGPLTTGIHLKFLYENTKGKKVGDLGSFDLPFTGDDDGGSGDDGGTIPEPATLLLMAGGLGAAAFTARRRRPTR